MVRRIEQDKKRFEDIVRGRIRRNLKHHITQGELIGRKGKEAISIPLPQMNLPRFRHGSREQGGVGQGPGDVGQPMGGQPGQGQGGQGGSEPGEHVQEVEVSLEDLTALLGEELELPRIEPKGAADVASEKGRYNTIRRVGPEGLKSFKRTYREALKRQVGTGAYDRRKPVVVPIREDMRYRSARTVPTPQAQAVILYMMDVSGSMMNEQKEIVRLESFWLDRWIRRHYQGITSRYLIHDVQAREVDEQTFFTTRESGGTKISSAYQLAAEILEKEYPMDLWNVYLFHFSDGDNLSGGDNELCFKLLRERLLPRANLFGYGQVDSPSGSGKFLTSLMEGVQAENLVASRVRSRDDILGSIKEFLGTGR